jgi:hypothetical protein
MALFRATASLPHARVPMVSPRVAPPPARAARAVLDQPVASRPRLDAPPMEVIVRRRATVRLVLAAIIAFTLFGVVYLTQILHAASYQYQIDALMTERDQLQRELRSQRGTVAGLGAEPRVIQWAQQHELNPLGTSLRVRAR